MDNGGMRPIRKSKKPVPGKPKRRHLLKFAALGAVIVLLVLGPRWLKRCKEPPVNANATGEVALLVDASDSIPYPFISELTDSLDSWLRNLPNRTHVSLDTIDRDSVSHQPHENLVFCTPGPWKWHSWIYSNEEDLETFVTDVLGSVEAELRGKAANSTPLLERLSEVSRNAYGSRNDRRELWIISDMLQHSEHCSFYGDSECIDPEWVLNHPNFNVWWRSRLSGVNVKILMIPRESWGNDESTLKRFWETYLYDDRNGGAASVEWSDV